MKREIQIRRIEPDPYYYQCCRSRYFDLQPGHLTLVETSDKLSNLNPCRNFVLFVGYKILGVVLGTNKNEEWSLLTDIFVFNKLS